MDRDMLFELNVPYYIPCTYPLISSYIKRKNLDISTALLVNTALLGLPAFSNRSDRFEPNVNVRDVYRLEYNLMLEYIGIYGTNTQIDEAIKQQYLENYIKNNGIAIVSGTSYNLPYSKDYLSDAYIESLKNGRHIGIVDHWLCAYDIGFQTISIYDPVPNNFMGTINKSQFMSFWRGDRGVKQLADVKGVEKLLINGMLEITVTKTLTSQEIEYITKRLLSIIKLEYFNNRVVKEGNTSYYYGKQAIEKLREAYLELFDNDMDNNTQKIWRCFFEIKYSAQFIQLLVREIEHIYDSAALNIIKESLSQSIDTWKTVERIINANILRGRGINSIRDTILPKIDSAVYAENKAYDLIDRYKL